MESPTIQEDIKRRMPDPIHDAGNIENESSEQFQSFICELLDRNGVLNDLRAYLRGHIVHVLNSAQSGEPPLCQKRFVQRLDATLQAVNAIIAEYLLRQEFQYSLSVFLSEIPLTNMVFEFTKSLLNYKRPKENSPLKFTERDIYSIINFLGIKCDSTDMDEIIKIYGSLDSPPLLLCIFKCVQSHNIPSNIQDKKSLTKELYSKNIEMHIPKCSCGKCRHRNNCRNCQRRYHKLRDKYAKKNKELKLAFMQLKASYDSEIELMREEERMKADDILKAQAEHLEGQLSELKRRYAERETALERDSDRTRRFVRGLARRLRARLATVLDAATALRDERRRLDVKEENLKRKLTMAEEMLSSQGEELRTAICNELSALEGHLEAMKQERDTISKERAELESMRRKKDDQKMDQILKMNYDLMRGELEILKEHLKTVQLASKTKDTKNKEVLTEEYGISNINLLRNYKRDSYNNVAQGVNEARYSENIIYNNDTASNAPRKLVNNFRKEKNVNITADAQVQVSVEEPRSSLCPVISSEMFVKLSEQWCSESLHLKIQAAQQGSHLEYLAAQQTELRTELESRYEAARVTPPTHRVPAQSRIEKNTSIKKEVETGVHASVSAVPGGDARCVPDELSPKVNLQISHRGQHSSLEFEESTSDKVLLEEHGHTDTVAPSEYQKGKHKNQSTEEVKFSQDSVLQEAMFKLKKLEIEAEAVENAYLKSRKRRTERVTSSQANDRRPAVKTSQEPLLNMPDATTIHPAMHTIKPVSYFEDTKNLFHLHHKIDDDVRKYSTNLRKSFDVNQKQKTKIRNPTEKPIQTMPKYRDKVEKIYNTNLLETPLLEFRKYYYASENMHHNPTLENSLMSNVSEIHSIVKDTATSPIVFLDNTEKILKKTNPSAQDSRKSEKEQSEIKKLEYTLKKMYVSHIKKDSTSGRKYSDEQRETVEHNSSEKLEEMSSLRVSNDFEAVEKESSGEIEIRQVDLTTVQDNSISTHTESEAQRSPRHTPRTSFESGIKVTERKREDFDLVDLLGNNDRSGTSHSDCDSEEKLIDNPEEPILDNESTSPKLNSNAVNASIEPNENANEHNSKSDHSKSNSSGNLTDLMKSDSPISLERYSSVDDNFWQ